MSEQSMSEQNNSSNVTREYKSNLPKVSMLYVLNLVFCFPIFFYPLLMLISASLKEAPEHLKTLIQVVDIVIWTYPVPLFILAWVFSLIWKRNPVLGKRVIVSAIIIELLLVIGLVILLI
ncbi:DUF5389 family protein [Psittacicella hinzii]|uniref:Uncharacterized protein n=1 Tax=Psittacicella hinzii TaxID=2028575 RepID=A0A3A1YBM6_9GAMM|nr:DUF5389 family protein [Psittacicella hinzii]RIY35085.1 hypothetical protein CKF58_07110 [Psittacicella hinzii]